MRDKKYNQFLLILLLAMTSFYPEESRTQGMCLEKGEKGLTILGGFSFSKNSHAAGLALGFSVGSTLDVGIGYGKIVIDDTRERFTYITPSVSIYLVDQTEETPLSLGLFYNYEIINDRNNYSRYNVASYGAFVFHEFSTTPKSKFIPEIGIMRSESDKEILYAREKHVTSIVIGFNLCSDYRGHVMSIVNPDIAINKDNIAFGISFGFIFTSEK